MSIDVHWDSLTGGADGRELSEAVRRFIDDRFQQIELPRFIRSVRVHSFDFGSIAPEIELKDICDPLPDFYEESDDEKSEDAKSESSYGDAGAAVNDRTLGERERNDTKGKRRQDPDGRARELPRQDNPRRPATIDTRLPGLRSGYANDHPGSPLFPGGHIQGIPGGTSNMSYFHLPLGAGLSGTTTPLAAVAGAQYQTSWPDHGHHEPQEIRGQPGNQHTPSAISSGEPSVADVSSRPSSKQQSGATKPSFGTETEAARRTEAGRETSPTRPHSPRIRTKSVEDIQIVSRVSYAGNVQISLTAEILLDYPMPSFVGIPLKVNITGLAFDGIAILAYIRKRVHFCFLSPEDAETMVGGEPDGRDAAHGDVAKYPRPRMGGLLEEMKVECQIGEVENGKQVLKNVGKVEKFVLEQVRRTFEDELVYPSFWTFLV